MGSDIIISLQKRPPIPPRSRIPSRTGITSRSITPTPKRRSQLQLSLPTLSPPSELPSTISLNQVTKAVDDNKKNDTIYKACNGHQQRNTTTKEQELQPHFLNPVGSNKRLEEIEPSSTAQYISKRTSSLSVAEVATRFLEEKARNCIKPRIFPMDSTSLPCERVPTPFVFTSQSRIHYERRHHVPGLSDKLFRDVTTRRTTAVISHPRSRAAVASSSSSCLRFSMMSNYNGLSSVSHEQNQNRNNSLAKSNATNHRSDFASVLKKWSVPIPPALSRKLGRPADSPLGKVKVMLRVCDNTEESNGPGILGVDQRRKQVTLLDPGGMGPNGITPEERRVGVSAPKMFAFDGIFGEDDDQAEICAASAAELVASVIGGEDGCLVSLGHSSAGKKQTMFGKPANQKLGAVPTAISWLFKCVQELKQKSGSRFSIRVSALEVTGGSVHETITDLLLPFVNDGDQPPGAYLLDGNGSAVNGHKGSTKSVTAPVLNSVSEVRVPNPETAGFYLDSALDAIQENNGGSGGHFVYTLHVYQYSIDKNGKGVVGGRSRLHCVMLGNGSPSISVLSGLLLAVLNGQRHLPSSNHSKLGAILRECLGSLTCRAVVMIHISNSHSRYAETLAALQLGSRVHRLRRSRRLKMGSVGSGTGSGGGSSGGSGGSGEEMRNGGVGTTNQLGDGELGSSDVDPSSSEQSCDTVIYLGPSLDEATDGEHPPVYLPSLDTTENGNTKVGLSKCPVPKTKSPKPKSSNKILSEGSFGSGSSGVKSEEKWVDGPKVSRHRQLQQSHNPPPPSSPKKKGETWIDGPAARVNHQASNFPSPKKSVNSHQNQKDNRITGSVPNGLSDPCCISSTKAEMISKWISNQTHSPAFFDDISKLDDSFFGGAKTTNGCIFSGGPQFSYHGINGQIYPYDLNSVTAPYSLYFSEPEYKALTVFKTCEDEIERQVELPEDQNFEFEFIEVVEPEIPVPTNDVSIQVTEEDIAISFLEGENPLPESEQNCVFSLSRTLEREKKVSQCNNDTLYGSSLSLPTIDKTDHPLRVLSEECLTVVSTFTGSSSNGNELERFWQSNAFLQGRDNGDMKICHGLCTNLVTLSQMSLDNLNDYPLIPTSQKEESTDETQGPVQHKPPTGKIALTEPPSLSSEGIIKIPPTLKPRSSSLTTQSRKTLLSLKDGSDAEQDNISIPPMELIDINQIKTNCHPIEQERHSSPRIPPSSNLTPVLHPGCDHHHHHYNTEVPSSVNGSINGSPSLSSTHGSSTSSPHNDATSTPSPQSLSPVIIPIQIAETNGKSPSKSKARKIARFFRKRSNSPKKMSSTSNSESEKSSVSSSDKDNKHSSSSSSCSSGISIPSTASSNSNSSSSKPKQHTSPKHQSPSKKQSLKVHPGFSSSNGRTDYHYTCESALPVFLPPTAQKQPTELERNQTNKVK